MIKTSRCEHCNCNLAREKEVHVVEGINFCSKRCAIEHLTDDIILNAKELAIEEYNDKVEIVVPSDVGMVYEKIWTAYSRDTDTTTIFLSKCLDENFEEVISVEVVGFYFGEPNEQDTESYNGEIKATY